MQLPAPAMIFLPDNRRLPVPSLLDAPTIVNSPKPMPPRALGGRCEHRTSGRELSLGEWQDPHAFWLPGELQVAECTVTVFSDEDVDFASAW
jgi:hypothetical protein